MNIFKVGDYVQVTSTHGSIGVVVALSRNWYGQTYDCKWSYGRDRLGQQVTAISRSVSPYMLVKISRYKWLKARARASTGFRDALRTEAERHG